MPDEYSDSVTLYVIYICISPRFVQTTQDVTLDDTRLIGLKESVKRIEYTDRYQELSKQKESQFVFLIDSLYSRLILSLLLNYFYLQMVNWLHYVHFQPFTC